MKTFLATVAVAAAATFAAGAASAADLITNGSFETGDFTGWTQSGDLGFTAVQGNFGGVDPSDGSFQAYFGPTSGFGSITENIATVANEIYTFSFDLQNFGGTPSGFNAYFDGVNVMSQTDAPAFPYSTNTFTVTASSAMTAVTLSFFQSPSYYLLDKVSVVDTGLSAGGVPEPASWALMLTGFFGAGAALRSTRRRSAVATA